MDSDIEEKLSAREVAVLEVWGGSLQAIRVKWALRVSDLWWGLAEDWEGVPILNRFVNECNRRGTEAWAWAHDWLQREAELLESMDAMPEDGSE